MSSRNLVWCTCTAYQMYRPQKYPSAIHQNRAVPIARFNVQSVPAQAASTMFEIGLAEATEGAASPSGSSPMSSGRFRSNRLIGASTARIRMPIAVQAFRQPVCSIMSCTQGNSVTEPIPTPANARPMAKPRRRINQLGRNND